MPWKATVINLTDGESLILTEAERERLQSWVRASCPEQRLVLRAKLILAADRGETTTAIATQLGVTPVTVSKWRTRFAQRGLPGLPDAPRPGKPAKYTLGTEQRLLAQLDEAPPPGQARGTGSLLAATLGEVSADYVWRVLRRHGVDL